MNSTDERMAELRSRPRRTRGPDLEVRAVPHILKERPPGVLMQQMKAIRAFCLGCEDRSKGVALCVIPQCPLWPYRFGSGTQARRIVAEEREHDDLPKKWWAEKLATYTDQACYKRWKEEREREQAR